MAKIFGVDIRKVVGQAVGSGLPLVSLLKVTPGTRTTGSLSGGNNPTSQSFSVRGVVSAINVSRFEAPIDDATAQVTLIADGLPETVSPAVGDEIVADGVQYVVVNVKTDPAKAAHTLRLTEK